MSILVTGGGGFIGSNLVRALADEGHAVRVLDNWSTGSPENLVGLEDTIQVFEGDVRDADDVTTAAGGVELVYHLAALPSVARSIADPFASHSVNATGTLNLLACAKDAGVRRVVYASSSSVYGDTPTLPKSEDMPANPLSPYAVSKLAGESYCRAFAHAYGLETVSLRFFNVFGPRQDPQSEYAAVIPRFVTRMLSGERPHIFGDGTQSRDFTFVSNAVDACLRAGTPGQQAAGAVVNVGCGSRISLLEVVESLNTLLHTALKPVHDPPRPGDVMHSQADISRADALLGYRPQLSVHDGLARTVEWFAHDPANELVIGKGAR
jgi:nucleoside-diphosphate-sugar epimerase